LLELEEVVWYMVTVFKLLVVVSNYNTSTTPVMEAMRLPHRIGEI
jgi:hypothetical protein